MRFLLIQRPEGLGSKGCKVIVGQIIAHGYGFSDGVVQFQPLGHWELFDGVQEVENGGTHGFIIIISAYGARSGMSAFVTSHLCFPALVFSTSFTTRSVSVKSSPNFFSKPARIASSRLLCHCGPG